MPKFMSNRTCPTYNIIWSDYIPHNAQVHSNRTGPSNIIWLYTTQCPSSWATENAPLITLYKLAIFPHKLKFISNRTCPTYTIILSDNIAARAQVHEQQNMLHCLFYYVIWLYTHTCPISWATEHGPLIILYTHTYRSPWATEYAPLILYYIFWEYTHMPKFMSNKACPVYSII